MPKPAAVKRLISEFINRSPIRTTSLIITIFGDSVSQHGRIIWLSSLVKALAPLGINERLVRTSVFRLVKDGWLESERVGRRSFYRFTHYGTNEYERAARRIYALENPGWQGRWQLLIPRNIPAKDRDLLKRSLHWQGYRTLAPDTFAKPGDGGRTLRETLDEFGVADKVMILDAEMSAFSSNQVARELVQDNWHLDEVAAGYRDFLAHYSTLSKWAQKVRAPAPETAFIARTLLIHDYRRVLLRDTPLPDELLPRGWPGAEARKLTGQIYTAMAKPSCEYIMSELESGNGSMPNADANFWHRFDSDQTGSA